LTPIDAMNARYDEKFPLSGEMEINYPVSSVSMQLFGEHRAVIGLSK
jgi:hypothetical protein